MGFIDDSTVYQSSERASVRIAAKSTRPNMPVPAPVTQYVGSYMVPIVYSLPSPASTQAHISYPRPYHHFLPSPQPPPQDQFERKRSYATASSEGGVSSVSPRPTSSTTVTNSGGSTDDTPKAKKPRTKKVTGGSSGGESNALPLLKFRCGLYNFLKRVSFCLILHLALQSGLLLLTYSS